MIYVYALADPMPTPALTVLGIGDRPIQSVSRRSITAFFSPHETASIVPTRENLLRHEQVAEALMSEMDLLPARFGTRFATEEELCGVLERHAHALRVGLERVRQCVELGLRVLWQPIDAADLRHPETTTPSSGREYMVARLEKERQRLRREDRAASLAARLQTPLIPLTRERSCRLLPTPSLLLTAAYLVPRDHVDDFRQGVDAMAVAHPELRLLCTGPWPPYHFAPVLPVAEEHHV